MIAFAFEDPPEGPYLKVVRAARWQARKRGLQSADVDDVGQEAALRCLRFSKRHADEPPGAGLAKKTASSAIADEFRRRLKRIVEFRDVEQIQPKESFMLRATPAQTSLPPPDVTKHLAFLRPRARDLVTQYFLHCVPIGELAARLDISTRAVEQRLRRAIQTLRDRFQS